MITNNSLPNRYNYQLNDDLYEILEVDPDCEMEDIRNSYKKLSLKYHPDKNSGKPEMTEKFKKIRIAYEILSSYKKRKEYDEFLDSKFSNNIGNNFDLSDVFGGFYKNFDPFSSFSEHESIFDKLFDIQFNHMTIPNNRSSVYVQKTQRTTNDNGNRVYHHNVKTNFDGKINKYEYHKEIDRNGKIISEKGNKIPYDKINNNYENWLSNFNKQKLENNNNKIRLL